MNHKIKNIIIVCAIVLLPLGYVHAAPTTDDNTGGKNTSTKLDTPAGPGTSSEQPLVTCGGADKNGNPQPPCTTNDFFLLIQTSIELVFKLAGFIVAGMFMYAGFLLITAVGDPGKITKAKTIFRRTIIGLIIMFLSYLLVKNIITKLFDLKGSNGDAGTVQQFLLEMFK
ncbi:MAG: Type secretion system pilin [Candidatus Parcubacteria bacterium]|jgi:hypothetical protein